MRVVLDTNIVVSGLFWQGPPAVVWQRATDAEFVIFASKVLLSEYATVLTRRKFAAVFAAVGRTADRILTLLRQFAEIVEPVDVPMHSVRDEKDRIVLACAAGGRVDVIVSGDEDLVSLGAYENIPILTAAQFLVWWESAQT